MPVIIDKVESWIKKNEKNLCSVMINIAEHDIDELLNERDKNPFDENWVQADKRLEEVKNNLAVMEKSKINQFSQKIGKRYFKLVIEKSGSSELASYISDDFRLLAETLSCEIECVFVFSLINAYLKGKMPENNMKTISYNPSGLY